jgi:hypothetical protein
MFRPYSGHRHVYTIHLNCYTVFCMSFYLNYFVKMLLKILIWYKMVVACVVRPLVCSDFSKGVLFFVCYMRVWVTVHLWGHQDICFGPTLLNLCINGKDFDEIWQKHHAIRAFRILIKQDGKRSPEWLKHRSEYNIVTDLTQFVARQQLCKHGQTCNNGRGCSFYVVRV